MANTNRPMIRIHDLSTNEVIDREMNDEEYAAWQADQEANAKAKAEAKAKADYKAAVLAKFGLSEQEVQALFS